MNITQLVKKITKMYGDAPLGEQPKLPSWVESVIREAFNEGRKEGRKIK